MFYRDLLQRLAEKEIAYCVVGGVAVNLHGVPRMTYDVDLAVELSPQNLEAVEQALTELGLSCRQPISLKSLADAEFRGEMRDKRNMTAVTFTDPENPIREVDLLISTAMPFSQMIKRAVELDLDGVPVWVVSLEDLIASKNASERAQDQDDVKLLKQILSANEEDARPKDE